MFIDPVCVPTNPPIEFGSPTVSVTFPIEKEFAMVPVCKPTKPPISIFGAVTFPVAYELFIKVVE